MSDERRLDLGLLRRALDRLNQALRDYDLHFGSDAFRDSVVIRFVFTYELFVQVLFRYVEAQHRKFTPESEMTKAKAVRRANDLGVLRMEWEEFVRYRDARNGVAHAYSEAKALRVVELAQSFAEEAEYLILRVKEKVNG